MGHYLGFLSEVQYSNIGRRACVVKYSQPSPQCWHTWAADCRRHCPPSVCAFGCTATAAAAAAAVRAGCQPSVCVQERAAGPLFPRPVSSLACVDLTERANLLNQYIVRAGFPRRGGSRRPWAKGERTDPASLLPSLA